jgi:hypothetical protein
LLHTSLSQILSKFTRRWTIDNRRCYARLSYVVYRLVFALLAAGMVSCGREASPRAAATIVATAVRRHPTLPPAPTRDAAAALEVRALGDPNAPITVIEYGDYQ